MIYDRSLENWCSAVICRSILQADDVGQRFSIWGDFAPQGTFANVWAYAWLSKIGMGCYCAWDDAIYPTMNKTVLSPQHTCTLTITQHKMSIVSKLWNPGAGEQELNTGRMFWAQISTGNYSSALWLWVSCKIFQRFLPCTNRADATLRVVKRITWAKLCEVSASKQESGEISFSSLPHSPFLIPLPQRQRWVIFNKRNSRQALLVLPLLKKRLKSEAASEECISFARHINRPCS